MNRTLRIKTSLCFLSLFFFRKTKFADILKNFIMNYKVSMSLRDVSLYEVCVKEEIKIFMYMHEHLLQNTRTSAECCFGYESSKQDLCQRPDHKAHHARSESGEKRSEIGQVVDSDIRFAVERSQCTWLAASDRSPRAVSFLRKLRYSSALLSSFSLSSFLFFSFYRDLPRKTLFDGE